MRKSGPRLFLLLCWAFCGCAGIGFAVSPKTPAELGTVEGMEFAEWSPWLLTRIKQLETERKELQAKLARSPRYNPMVPQNFLGYHSAIESIGLGDADEPHSITFSFPRRQYIQSIAFAPAASPLGPADGSYAFPKHFKLEVLDADSSDFRTVVDWIDEAFPDPGAYPVFFSGIDQWAKEIRLTVPKRDPDGNYVFFALGEVYLFGGKPSMPLENLALWPGTKIEASGSFDLARHWDLQFLRDRLNNLGFPVMNRKDPKRMDFLLSSGEGYALPDTVEILLDFSSIKKGVGRLDIWPAEPPNDLALLGYGFPENVTIEFSVSGDFEDSRELTRQALMESSRRDFRSLFSVRVRPLKARYARIRMSGLQEVGGSRILGLGEISLYQSDGTLARGASVSIKGLPPEFEDQLGLLQDGYSWGRRILSEADWIQGLAKRRYLDERLALVRSELASARRSLREMQRQAAVAGGIALVVLFAGVLVLQRRKRKRMLRRLGERITRDLHDEVGSNLGSITLMAEELAAVAGDRSSRSDLEDLSLMAREANASLREIVWGSEQASVPLRDFLEKLSERAERVFKAGKVEVVLPEQCPDVNVSLTVKRHLMMFFKEAVHNCVRHAGASEMKVVAEVDGAGLVLEVRDDGCGFDSAEGSRGWGLSNMKKRAAELGGEVEIDSRIGEGTAIVLRVPLHMLSKEPKKSYKTSN